MTTPFYIYSIYENYDDVPELHRATVYKVTKLYWWIHKEDDSRRAGLAFQCSSRCSVGAYSTTAFRAWMNYHKRTFKEFEEAKAAFEAGVLAFDHWKKRNKK